jgi:hypothetical protein
MAKNEIDGFEVKFCFAYKRIAGPWPIALGQSHGLKPDPRP